jgi:hypothetical protein
MNSRKEHTIVESGLNIGVKDTKLAENRKDNNSPSMVYLVDFGLSGKYRDINNEHIRPGKVAGRVGNMHFMSLNHIKYNSRETFANPYRAIKER